MLYVSHKPNTSQRMISCAVVVLLLGVHENFAKRLTVVYRL